MEDPLIEVLARLKVRSYDEADMPQDLKDKILKFVPPALFRQVKYPDSDEFEFEVQYLLDVNKDGVLYSPWVEVPAFEVEYVEGGDEDEQYH